MSRQVADVPRICLVLIAHHQRRVNDSNCEPRVDDSNIETIAPVRVDDSNSETIAPLRSYDSNRKPISQCRVDDSTCDTWF